MEKKIVFVLVLAVAFLVMTGEAVAFHGITGTVFNATDGTPANGHTVIIYYFGDEANNVSDTIGPTGASGTNNMYMCDAEMISNHTWVPGAEIYVEVIDNGDGYTTEPVSVVTTTAAFDVAPDMTLLPPLPPIVSDPQAIPPEIVVDTEFTELRITVTKTYFDIANVTINLTPIGGTWVPMDGSTYTWLTMYAMSNLSEDITVYNCTTNASVVGSFNLIVNATDIKGKSNTSVSIPLAVTNATTRDYNLVKKAGSTGKNWISIPLDTTITNASSLMDAIGANCDAVSRWNPEEQKSEAWISYMGGMGIDFDVVPGEGYEVSVTANTTFNLTGIPVEIGQIDLIKKPSSTGKNWIGLPYSTTMTNASSLMDAIGANCDAVSRWNPEEQKSEAWISYMGGMGINFDVVPGEGYEVSVTANTTWTPN